MEPLASQSETVPSSLLIPAIPPTVVSPLTTPANVQSITEPELSPTMPPTTFLLPPGITLPITIRFLTTASF